MFEKMNTSFVSTVVIVVHGFINVCVVIVAFHNQCWWKLKHILGGNNGSCLASLPGVHLQLLFL